MRHEIAHESLSFSLFLSYFFKRRNYKIILYDADVLIQNQFFIHMFRLFKIPLEQKKISLHNKSLIYKPVIDTLNLEEENIDSKIIMDIMKITGLSEKVSVLYIKKNYRPHLVTQHYLKKYSNSFHSSFILSSNDFNRILKKN